MRRTLAQAGVCQVQSCACGTVHLTVGPVTISLYPGALADVARASAEALRGLASPQVVASRAGAQASDATACEDETGPVRPSRDPNCN